MEGSDVIVLQGQQSAECSIDSERLEVDVRASPAMHSSHSQGATAKGAPNTSCRCCQSLLG